jgi:hypothetical protein
MQTTLLSLLMAGATILQMAFGGTLAKDEKTAARPYTNSDLDFSYMRPSGLRDLTETSKADDAANRRDGKVQFKLLLLMSSGPDDQAADWVTVGITTLPRGRDKDKGDDLTAGFFTNHSLGQGVTTRREIVKFAGQDFSSTHFQKSTPPTVKYAILYTVVRKERFLSFFFSGNDRATVQRLAKSMETLKFQP